MEKKNPLDYEAPNLDGDNKSSSEGSYLGGTPLNSEGEEKDDGLPKLVKYPKINSLVHYAPQGSEF